MRKYSWISVIAIVALIALAACAAPAAPAPSAPPAAATQAPAAATEAPAAATQAPAAATEAPAAPAGTATPAALGNESELKPVPRNQTLYLGWFTNEPVGLSNPWGVPGYTAQAGNATLWEPLAYYGIFASESIPWLADSMEYNDDFTQLTIKLNPDAAWSDGEPVTSKDVVFTFEGQKNNEKMEYHADFDTYVEDVTAPDDHTVVVNFKVPAPRFAYEVLTMKFDTGIEIVPEHVLSKEADVNAFQGGLDMPHSGPYSIVYWDSNQKIFDLREDWWAVKAGKHALPDVKRFVVTNITGQQPDQTAQRVINNEFDSSLDTRASIAKSLVEGNDKITTHSGSEPPYGYLDWWPNSLWMNTQLAPYDDPNVRRAICETIDRQTINDVVYDGATVATIYPFPLYPALQKFVDSPGAKALEEKYQPGKFDLEDSAKLMEGAGFTKNANGLWEKDGQTVNATIHGLGDIHSDIAPVLEEMLRNGGFDASVNFGTDSMTQMGNGAPGLYMFGHGASTVDPFAAFNLYHSKYSSPLGTSAGNGRWSRYNNPEFDALVDQMAPLSADDPKFLDLATQALGIYWRDTIDCPIIQWLHRIPYNQTYWTNWPTAANLADGENGAFWAGTGTLVITGLKASGAQ